MDYRHGFGKYQWNDSNVYEGMFFMNYREGYGTLSYSSGNIFTVSFKIFYEKMHIKREVGFLDCK